MYMEVLFFTFCDVQFSQIDVKGFQQHDFKKPYSYMLEFFHNNYPTYRLFC